MKVWLNFLLIFCVFSSQALAHKVNLLVNRQKEVITGESYFADGSPCKKCAIKVYDSKGVKIAETKTDEWGKFILSLSERGELKIVVEAGEGHRAEQKIKALTFEKFSEKRKEKIKEKGENLEENSLIKQTIEDTIDSKLQNLKTELLLEIKKEINKIYLKDIIGGIGYIFGIWGIIAILKNRKKVHP